MKKSGIVFLALFVFSFSSGEFLFAEADVHRKALVLGIDGMDPHLLETFMSEGKMPHFKKLLEQGGDFKRLQTSYPPQSPVAWSSVAVGANPGKHGIFDFIHRQPQTQRPYLSITETKQPQNILKLGPWQIPLSQGSVKNLRGGKPFWQYLCEEKVPSTICQIPANYPPDCPCVSDHLRILSGMGTPDLLGTQGTFSFYTSQEMELKKVIGGGRMYTVQVENGKVRAEIAGPPHPYKNPDWHKARDKNFHLTVPFTVWLDEENQTAKLSVSGQDIFLRKGEFSDFVKVRFDVIPGVQSVPAICRFFLKEVSPHFKLYVSPLVIDPSSPALPISQPASYAQELFNALGPFYTQNMPPDTKALEHKVFADEEFLKQIKIVFQEEEKRLDFELERFQQGLLFHYFSVLDQLSHVFWRTIDPKHPLYTPELNAKHGKAIEGFYIEFDRIVGKIIEKFGQDTLLIVMSDHGFTSFRRGINLNTILLNRGFITLIDSEKQEEGEFFPNVDWSKTKAYNLGINALYLNLHGREPEGRVKPEEYGQVVESLRKLLLEYVDPKTGEHPIQHVAKRDEIYHGPYLQNAPDLIVGYAEGYRASWDTILGEMPKEEVVDNLSTWSGDHTIYFNLVPGILVANRKIIKENPALEDLAPTLLEYFGIAEHSEMEGSSFVKKEEAPS